MTSEMLMGLLPDLLGGLLLGSLFFGGLWLTVRRGLASPRPWLWFGLSSLLRTMLVLAGFWWLAGNDWRGFLAALLGFTAAKVLAAVLSRKSPPYEGQAKEG
ncbi:MULTISPECIES: ATP synthase subunit I [Chlorobium/Pelodictyon group]|uniref:ATP synthase subunit I n=1 Tax=Chlorobium luteolum (strain DSM 273 / BCRC 81028 / 2530) TaxID=319225 RepID=Q3B403_CHLL3|nr:MULTISPECIES: ATP synthase subunit I [Chlorobium/Pelodictyon group]ABB23928.1 conserved hypothetical protein [Pelodictyon luteolum DSM 273]TCD47404.1 hypothetical protein E0L29_07600 [Chlorobium sp. N1]